MQVIYVTLLDFLWSGVVSNLYHRKVQRDYHQHVRVDSTDHTHKHKRPEKDVKVHPARLNVAAGVGEPERQPQDKSLRPHFLPSTDAAAAAAAAQSATPPAEERRTYGGKHNRRGEGASEGTFDKHSGAGSWSWSSRAAAPLDVRRWSGLARVTSVTLLKRRRRHCWSYNVDCVLDLYWKGDRGTSCGSQPAQLSVYIPVRG